jgi:hypothetical protein
MTSTQRISSTTLLLSLTIIWSVLLTSTNGFSVPANTAATVSINNNNTPLCNHRHYYHLTNQSPAFVTTTRSTSSSIMLRLSANDNNTNDDDSSKTKKKKGDSIRSTTGIRPSLHPTEINCIAEALMLRSTNNPTIDIDVTTSSEPLQVAIAAGSIAMNAIDKRNSDKDDTSEKFTMEESQTISGRVVGVVMRMRELEELLVQRVSGVGWVKKYGEEESFGVLRAECSSNSNNDDPSTKTTTSEELEKKLAETIKINPLFRMNRAECLLGLFLDTVERPKLELLGEGVAGGSEVDFIDAERLEVLLTTVE